MSVTIKFAINRLLYSRNHHLVWRDSTLQARHGNDGQERAVTIVYFKRSNADLLYITLIFPHQKKIEKIISINTIHNISYGTEVFGRLTTISPGWLRFLFRLRRRWRWPRLPKPDRRGIITFRRTRPGWCRWNRAGRKCAPGVRASRFGRQPTDDSFLRDGGGWLSWPAACSMWSEERKFNFFFRSRDGLEGWGFAAMWGYWSIERRLNFYWWSCGMRKFFSIFYRYLMLFSKNIILVRPKHI